MVATPEAMWEKPRVERCKTDIWFITMLAAVVVGAILRLWDLTVPSLAHPEIYIPGIDLPPGISEPPPRHGFFETLSWHFYSEPHPPGYYMAMWVWTKLFGTSELALRLPGASAGIASIWVMWRLGVRLYDRKTAALAAALIALSGFHIYWSQMARMYAPGTLIACLSTGILAAWMQSGRARPKLEIAYVVMIIAGTQSVELFWAIPFLHLAWVAIIMPMQPGEINWHGTLLPWADAPRHRMIQVQSLALALSSPEFIHAALQARSGAAPDPTPHFLIDYMAGGFLFESSAGSLSIFAPPLWGVLAIGAVVIALAFLACRRPNPHLGEARPRPIPLAVSLAAIAFSAGVALFLASISARHQHILMVGALVPILCLWLPGLTETTRRLLDTWLPALMNWLRRIPPFTLLLLMLAFVPPVVFYLGSIKMSVLAPRAFLPFVPFALLLITAGAIALTGWLRAVIIATLMVLGTLSTLYFHATPKSPRDYKGLAQELTKAYQPGDIIFIRRQNWADTPFFYYMPNAQFITDDEANYFVTHRPARVWLIDWQIGWNSGFKVPSEKTTAKRLQALSRAGYTSVQALHKVEAHATLFLPSSPAH